MIKFIAGVLYIIFFSVIMILFLGLLSLALLAIHYAWMVLL